MGGLRDFARPSRKSAIRKRQAQIITMFSFLAKNTENSSLFESIFGGNA
jgi:hypothetical protein